MTFKKHESGRTLADLQKLQQMPLQQKVIMTKARIRQWVERYGIDHVYVSFSGGKDSTVLLHIAREMYPDIKAVFFDTFLEFPEVRKFALSFDNVEVIKPKMNFRETIVQYGYPIFSKEISEAVYGARRWLTALREKYDNPSDRQTDRQTDRRESAHEWYFEQRRKALPGSVYAQQLFAVSGAEEYENGVRKRNVDNNNQPKDNPTNERTNERCQNGIERLTYSEQNADCHKKIPYSFEAQKLYGVTVDQKKCQHQSRREKSTGYTSRQVTSGEDLEPG